jgi:hypothetical protein
LRQDVNGRDKYHDRPAFGLIRLPGHDAESQLLVKIRFTDWASASPPRHSGTARSAGPGIQNQARRSPLDSGFAAFGRGPE